MLCHFIFLSFLTLSAALRRAAVHTQNLDQVAADSLRREQHHRLLAKPSSAVAEAAARTMNVSHKDFSVSVFDQIEQLTPITSELISEAVLVAQRQGMLLKADASRSHGSAELYGTHEADVAHAASSTATAIEEQHEVQKVDVALEANSSQPLVKREVLVHKGGVQKKSAVKLVMMEESTSHKAKSMGPDDILKENDWLIVGMLIPATLLILCALQCMFDKEDVNGRITGRDVCVWIKG